MGFYRSTILPFLLDKATGTRELAALRREMLAPARGRVLEIGFGTGLNAPHYPAKVERVVAMDPNYPDDKRARKRIERASVPIELRRAAGEDVPLDASSFDTVVTSLVLCSVADAPRTLAEVRRVLKPGGHYLFLEHGLSDEPDVQKWQKRLTGLH